MQKNTTQLHNVTPEQLKAEILQGVKDLLSEHFENTSTDDKLLTRKDVAKLLSISLPTLRSYVKRGIIKEKSIGSRRLYSLSDIYDSFPSK